jgi:predicted TIM-barrel fold metal-dependent hydrolase
MEALEYGLFDADNHYFEPRDAFTRHMEPRHRDKAIHVVKDDAGKDLVLVGERPFTFLPHRSFDFTLKPGTLREMLRNFDRLDEADLREAIQPEYVTRDARLQLMDAQGLESILIFPTFGVCLEHFMKDDVEQTYANLRAFNRWLDEEWGFAYRERVYAPALMSLLDVEHAVEDLERALARGARAIHIRPGPAAGRNPADPHFDPFWARVDEARLLVTFHISESGYNEMISVHWGEQPNPPSHGQSAFQWTNFYGDRPIMDTISALILGNLFGRYPNIRIASVENGSIWVSYLMKAMDKMIGMGRNGPWIGGRVTEKPSAIFRRHVFVSPFYTEDIAGLVSDIGASQVLFGSDFPHQECIARPADFAKYLEGLPDEEIRRIMRENTRGLLSA